MWDWRRPDVQRALQDYQKKRGVDTLCQLQQRIRRLTGRTIALSTLSYKLRRMKGLSSVPKAKSCSTQTVKRDRLRTDNFRNGPLPDSDEESDMSADDDAESEEVSGKKGLGLPNGQPWRLNLSKDLNDSLLIVPDNDLPGFVRKFSRVRIGPRSSFFRCNRCHYLKEKYGDVGKRIIIRTANGRVMNRNVVHYAECEPIPELEAIVQQIDRMSRLEVRRGNLEPKEAWMLGFDTLVTKAMEANLDDRDHNIAELFPAWDRVRKQYFRLRNLGRKSRQLIPADMPISPQPAPYYLYVDEQSEPVELSDVSKSELCSEEANGGEEASEHPAFRHLAALTRTRDGSEDIQQFPEQILGENPEECN